MTFGLDTSMVIRLLTGTPRDVAERALSRFQNAIAAGDDFFVNDVVATETYWALQHHYRKSKEEALDALRAFSDDGCVRFSPNFDAAISVENIHRANPGFVDRILASDYRSRGQITLSCEKSFKRLPDAEVV